MTILLTGASGLLGRAVLRELRGAGYTVVAVAGRRKVDDQTVLANLADPAALAALPTKAECIIHLAAFVPEHEREVNPELTFPANALATLNLLEFAARHEIRNFVYGSSCSVYGHWPSNSPLREEEEVHPTDFYAASKLDGEVLTLPYGFFYRLSVKILRFSYIYGMGMRRSTAVCTFVDLARQGRPLPLFNEGRDRMDPLYVKDAAAAVLAAVGAGEGVFNIGSGGTISVRELAETIIRVTGSPSTLEFRPSAGSPRTAFMQIEKARADLGWRPSYDLEAGIRDFLSEYA